MYWMRGPAGVGKSAIPRTSRKWAPRSCILFHCQRAQQSLAVVYYNHLSTHDTLPDYRADVEHRIFNDNTIVEKKMPSQFLSTDWTSVLVETLKQKLSRSHSYTSMLCCMFIISEHMFKDICHHLHAVISYEASYDPLSSIDPHFDLTDGVFMVHRISITNPSTISSVIPLAWCLLCQHSCLLFLDHMILDHHHYA